ncbi:MAG: DinB family protein [Ignavibacteria bacterium]
MTKKYTFYNYWANKKLINKLNAIPGELLSRELKSSFTTITKTILHMYDAETIWLKRLEGVSLTEWPSVHFKGSDEDALRALERSSFEIAEYVINVSDEKLHGESSFTSLNGKVHTMKGYDIIQHCMNHSTFHRGQIITMLRGLDINDLPSTDYIAYLRTNEK